MSKNNIITIAQRVQQSKLAKSSFKELQHIASKMSTDVSELWSNVPSLKADDFIDISNLRIDTNIQRDPFRGGRIKGLEKTMKTWDSRQFGRIKIAKKTGLGKDVYTVIDGQGRCIIAMARGLTQVPFEEVIVTDAEAEAGLFVTQADNTSTLTGWEKHKANLQRPNSSLYNQAKDIERVMDGIPDAHWQAQIVQTVGVDLSACHSAIKHGIIREAELTNSKANAGERKVRNVIGVINAIIDSFKVNGQQLVMRADVIYPCLEFVLSYKRDGVGRLRTKLDHWHASRVSNGHSVTLDDFANAIDLGRQKNAKDKRSCYKRIKSL